MQHLSIQQALQLVAERPQPATDEVTQVACHELIARSLYEIANTGDATVRGSMARANKARKMILDRSVGKRRAGTLPVTGEQTVVTFVDLTGRAVEAGAPEAH